MEKVLENGLVHNHLKSYLETTILSYTNKRSLIGLSLEFKDFNHFASISGYTLQDLKDNLILREKLTGFRIPSKLSGFLLESVDLWVFNQQKGRFMYLAKHYPNMVLCDSPSDNVSIMQSFSSGIEYFLRKHSVKLFTLSCGFALLAFL